MDNYQLSESASNDLDTLYLYGILNYGLRQADQYYNGLIKRFENLSEHPSWGSDYSSFAPNLRRYEYAAHSIYYQTGKDRLLIVRVLGNKQDPARHL